MNLLLSYGSDEDNKVAAKGYTFLGVAADNKGDEVHVFQMKTLEEVNAQDKLTEEDRNMIVYFHEKGDITSWSEWEKKKPLVEREYPQLIRALADLSFATCCVDNIVERIGDE